MSTNFVKLDQALSAIVERMTPPAVKASTTDLVAHFAARHEAAYAETERLGAQRRRAIEVPALVAVGAGLASVGVIATATAPVALPVAAAVGMGTMAVVAARILVHQARTYLADRELEQTRKLLEIGSEETLARAYAQEQSGGPLTQLYQRTKALVLGQERRANTLLARMDGTGQSGPEHQRTVQRLVRQAATPDFVEYMRRNASAPFSVASRLMARLKTLPEQGLAALTTPPVHRAPGVPRLGTTLVGLAPAGRMPSLLAELGVTAAARPPVPVTHYGAIAASESDHSFLQALGIELGTYNHNDGTFPAKLDAAALRQLDSYRDDFPAQLYALPDARVDSAMRRLDTGLAEAEPEILSGYRAYLRYAAGTELGGPEAAGLLAEVNREVHRRAARERLNAAPARTADAPSLEV